MMAHKAWNERILYVYPARFHFVAKDIEGLRERTTVHEHRFSSGPAWMLPWDLVRQLLFLIAQRAKGTRHVVAHFAGYHTVLPVVLGFSTHIVIAGSDACSFPGIDYGSFRKPWMRRAMSYSMRGASSLLPVHASLVRFDNRFSTFGPREQGYAHFVADLRTPSIPIPYGFTNADRTKPPRERAVRTVLCVATGVAPGNAVHFRKGVDLLIATARLLPDHRFTVIGAARPEAYVDLPTNLRIMGACTPSELREQLASHTIYTQPSVMEGFPNALCEAMLAGCLPVVSDITSMPAIVGNVGRVIQERKPEPLASAILELTSATALQQQEWSAAARERILPYTMELRLNALMNVMRPAPV